MRPILLKRYSNDKTIVTSMQPQHQQKNARQRLLQLDGLRGLAIVLVVFTHLRLGPVFAILPEPLQWVLSLLANNGGVGVSILFLLSGYLMMSLYPKVPSASDFWQKRYTRIFPAFFTMTVVLALVRSQWQVWSIETILGVWAGCIVVAGLLWWLIRRTRQRAQVGKVLFFGFLGLQVLVAVGYVLLQQFVPAAVFLQLWPVWAQRLVAWLVNATMTLPLGTYIGQLDGVYWSVCAEVAFYLLYPRICLPLFQAVVQHNSRLLNIFALLLVWPFTYGLQQIANGVFGFYLLQLHLLVFFILGMAVSQFQRSDFGERVSQYLQQVPQVLLGLMALVCTVASPLVWRLIRLPSGIDTMVWAVPLTIGFWLTVVIRGWWRRLLETKVMVLLGTISYALYLTHTLAIEALTRSGEPTTLVATLTILLQSFLVMLPMAALVHVWLERPYMQDKLVLKVVHTPHMKINQRQRSWWQMFGSWSVYQALLVVILGVGGLIWWANRVPVSLLSPVVAHQRFDLATLTLLEYDKPVVLSFVAEHNALGMLILNLHPLTEAERKALGQIKTGGETLAALRVTIKQNDQVIQQSEYPLYQIYQANFFPIGLPVQDDSQGKMYQVELVITAPHANTSLALVNKEAVVRSVYFPPKKTYLKQPIQAVQVLWQKLIQPFATHAGQFQLALTSPLLAIVWYAVWSRSPKPE